MNPMAMQTLASQAVYPFDQISGLVLQLQAIGQIQSGSDRFVCNSLPLGSSPQLHCQIAVVYRDRASKPQRIIGTDISPFRNLSYKCGKLG